jgi:hypothetical protein
MRLPLMKAHGFWQPDGLVAVTSAFVAARLYADSTPD